MDYAVGDKLALTIAAFNPLKPDEIVFPVGTEALIESMNENIINLKFPDGVTYAHEAKDLVTIFKHITTGKVLTQNYSGVGTPPRELFSFLPNGADWKKNYVWKFTISLEERADKGIICQNCTTEIADLKNTNSTGNIYCIGCKDYIVAFDLVKNEPYVVVTRKMKKSKVKS